MKNAFLSFLVLCLISGFILLSSCTQKAKSMDWISIEGNKFVNESGETIVFRGVNIRDPYPEKRDAPWEAKWEADWGYTPSRQGAFFKSVMTGL
jgi:hypothetical protein